MKLLGYFHVENSRGIRTAWIITVIPKVILLKLAQPTGLGEFVKAALLKIKPLRTVFSAQD